MRWAAALLLCLVPALAACGANSSNTLPAVAGGFGTDPLISLPAGAPRAFTLGSGQVIAGWNRGLAGQRVGSRVLLVIPPSLGYGKSGSPPMITGSDTLVYVVDILAALHG